MIYNSAILPMQDGLIYRAGQSIENNSPMNLTGQSQTVCNSPYQTSLVASLSLPLMMLQ
jgi:hypothetical protein